MPDCRLLNDVLIILSRGMLQYVGECSPWSGADAAQARSAVETLVAKQRDDVSRLAELLIDRDAAIDFGAYPTEFTSLHFLALEHLLRRLVDDERRIVGRIDEACRTAAGDDEAVELLRAVHTAEQERLATLVELAQATAA